jgi:hypothetical protein
MTNTAKAVSWSTLIGFTLAPPILFATGAINESTLKWLMFAGTVIWFIATPIWMKGDPS